MKREAIIPPRVWGANLYCGEIERKSGYDLMIYFIVNKTCEAEYIEKTALQFLLDEHTNYCFFGEFADEWITEFRKVAALTNLKHCPPFQKFVTYNEFVEKIKLDLHLRPIVPFEMYIVYDDAELYQKIKEMILNETNRQ